MIPKQAWLVLWLTIFALALAWRAQNLEAFGLSNDEGAHLMWAQLAVDGYPLYSQTQAVQAPLFIEAVGLAFRLGGATIQAGRWVALVSFGLLAATLSWLAYRAGGAAAALAALVLTGLSPLVFTFSRLVMAEVPATALAVLAVALAMRFAEHSRRGWLLASGLALGLSFIVKALNPFVVVPIAVLLAARYRANWRRLWVDLPLWGAGVILPVAAVPLIYGPAPVFDQLVAFRGELRAAVPGSWPETIEQFRLFGMSHWGFWMLAFGSIMAATLQLKGDRPLPAAALYQLTWGAWLAAGVAMLAWHTPLFPHHFVVLLPPLILLAAHLVTIRPRPGQPRRWSTYGPAVVAAVAIGTAIFNLPALIRTNQQTAAIVTGGREQQALQLLEAVSNPADFIMGDSQLLIFMANRRTPPPLGDVALVAIKAGRQSSGRMIALTETFRSPAVVQWSLRLPWLPDYLAWVEAHYLARREWDGDHIIYFAPRFPPDQPPPNKRLARLGEAMTLRGHQLDPASVGAGRELALNVYWQVELPLAQDYTVFTQLLDSNGALVAGRDSQPLGGHFPTSQWPANELITDVVRLPLPPDLPAGDYTLVTGMYLLETLERLPALDTASDFVTLTTVTVE